MDLQMTANKTYLIALDGSSHAPRVLAEGAVFARATGARVVVFRAIVIPPDFSPAGAGGTLDSLPAYLEQEARRELTALTASILDLSYEIRVEHGIQPWQSILAAADAVRANLTIIGSHGYHGWDRILGTTAAKVVNLAQRNVLVVHGVENINEGSPRDA